MKSRPRTRVVAAAVATVVAVTAAGCANNDVLAEQFRSGNGQNYISGDGTITEIAASDRGEPVTFKGRTDGDTLVSSADYAGRVLVVNFWYAACPPCRAEAGDLEATFLAFNDQGVDFLGVNVRDQAETARAFAREYSITYPSVMDVNDGTLQLAFSGLVAPNAVPTTLVIDRQGRVASRILGRLPDKATLAALLRSALAEPTPTQAPTSPSK